MIDRAMQMTVAAGEPIDLRYRRVMADGMVRVLLGEVYSLAIFDAARVKLAGAASVIERDMDGDLAALRIATSDIAALIGRVGLRWELSELLPGGGRQVRAGGLFVVTGSAATLDGTEPTVGEGDATWIIDEDDSE